MDSLTKSLGIYPATGFQKDPCEPVLSDSVRWIWTHIVRKFWHRVTGASKAHYTTPASHTVKSNRDRHFDDTSLWSWRGHNLPYTYSYIHTLLWWWYLALVGLVVNVSASDEQSCSWRSQKQPSQNYHQVQKCHGI